MKKGFIFAFVLALALLLAACAKSEEPTLPAATDESSLTETVAEVTEAAASLLTGEGWSYDKQTATLTLAGAAAYAELEYALQLDDWKELELPLQHLIVEDGVEYIGPDMFYGYSELQTIVFADSVEALGSYAFGGCTSLTKVEFGENSRLKTLGIGSGSVFKDCIALIDITFPDSLTAILGTELLDTAYAANPANWKNGGLYCGKHLLAIDKDAVRDHFIVEDGTISIARAALIEAQISTIDLPSSLKGISMRAFAFSAITEITIPDGIEKIEQELFDNCTELECVYLPASVNIIDMNAFNECTSLQDIYFGGTQEQWESILLNVGNTVLESVTIHFEA